MHQTLPGVKDMSPPCSQERSLRYQIAYQYSPPNVGPEAGAADLGSIRDDCFALPCRCLLLQPDREALLTPKAFPLRLCSRLWPDPEHFLIRTSRDIPLREPKSCQLSNTTCPQEAITGTESHVGGKSQRSKSLALQVFPITICPLSKLCPRI